MSAARAAATSASAARRPARLDLELPARGARGQARLLEGVLTERPGLGQRARALEIALRLLVDGARVFDLRRSLQAPGLGGRQLTTRHFDHAGIPGRRIHPGQQIAAGDAVAFVHGDPGHPAGDRRRHDVAVA